MIAKNSSLMSKVMADKKNILSHAVSNKLVGKPVTITNALKQHLGSSIGNTKC